MQIQSLAFCLLQVEVISKWEQATSDLIVNSSHVHRLQPRDDEECCTSKKRRRNYNKYFIV